MSRPRKNDKKSRHALFDLGYDDERTFCSELLQTPEFTHSFLRTFIKPQSGNKAEVCARLRDGILDGSVDATKFVLAYCRLPRRWLSLRIATTPDEGEVANRSAPSKVKPPTTTNTIAGLCTGFDFLTSFGNIGPRGLWFGPFSDGTDDRTWYIHARKERHLIVHSEGTAPTKVPVRWHVIVEVAPDHLAFHWNNFTHSDKEDRPTQENAFQYFKRMPGIVEQLEEMIGGDWEWPAYHDVIFNSLMPPIKADVESTWTHRRIRSERDGVAMNAHSSGAREIDVSGLEALTRAIAAAVIAKIPKTAGVKTSEIEDAVLFTIIKEWGTKSYEFEIQGPKKPEESTAPKEPKQTLFHAHVYFGIRADSESQDGFPHMQCWIESGGSTTARDYLLSYLVPSQ